MHTTKIFKFILRYTYLMSISLKKTIQQMYLNQLKTLVYLPQVLLIDFSHI